MVFDIKLHAIRMAIMLGVAAFCLAYPRVEVFPVVIVMGQAHFAMAYLYQHKAGKMNRHYTIKFSAAFVLMFGSYFLLGWDRALGFLAALYFVLHFLFDERHLLAEDTDFAGWMRLVPIQLVFGAWLLYDWYQINLIKPATALAVSGFLLWFADRLIKRTRLNGRDLSFILIFTLAFLFISVEPLFGVTVPDNALMFIILAHYMNWYFHYFVRFSDKPAAFNMLLKNTLILNVLFLLLYLAYRHIDSPMTQAGEFLFAPSYFYLWTMMHYVVTFRPSDLSNLVPDRRIA